MLKAINAGTPELLLETALTNIKNKIQNNGSGILELICCAGAHLSIAP